MTKPRFIAYVLIYVAVSLVSLRAYGQERTAIIESFRVVASQPDEVTIEATYTLGGSGSTAIFMGGIMQSKDGQTQTRGFTPSRVRDGRHTATVSLLRPESPLAQQTHLLNLYLYEGGKPPFIHRNFALVLDWPEKGIPGRAQGQDLATYNETLLNDAIELIDGINYLGDEQLNVAKKRLEQVILSDPGHVQAYLELARVAMKEDVSTRGHSRSIGVDEADRLIRTALKLNPDYANSHVLMGYVDAIKGRFDKAENHFRTARKIGTTNMWLYHNWGMLLERTQRPDDAIKLYQEAVALPISTKGPFATSNNRAIPIIFDRLIGLHAAKEDWTALDSTYRKRINALNEACVPASYALFKLYQIGDFSEAIKQATISFSNNCMGRARPVLAAAYLSEWALRSRSKPQSERDALLNRAQALIQNMAQVIMDLASSSQTVAVLPYLKEAGIDLDAQDAKGMTPLAYAVSNQHLPAIKGLLQAGAKANRVLNEQGWTILMVAVTTGRMDVVEILLEHHADPTLKTIDGITAMSIAKEAGLADIEARLERRHGV